MQIMKSFKNNTWGFALIIAISLLAFVTIMTVVFIEKLYPYTKLVRNIEDSNISYYYATASVEETLLTMSWTSPWNATPKTDMGTIAKGLTGYIMEMSTGSNNIPAIWKWNSPHDANWNILSLGRPVQIVIPSWVVWTDVDFSFRIPDEFLSGIPNAQRELQNMGSGYVNWMLIYGTGAFYASGELNTIKWMDIIMTGSTYGWIATAPYNIITDRAKNGKFTSPTWPTGTIHDYYINATHGPWNGLTGIHCNDTPWYQCTLKLSIIRPLVLVNDKQLPYIEYKVNFPTGLQIPLQFMTLQSYGFSRGYVRTRRIFVPQITTNTALDFTVFQ